MSLGFDNALPVRLPGKTVFVLGSGFSAPLGTPVIASFVREGLALLKESAWADRDAKKDRDLIQKMAALLDRYADRIAQLDGGTASLEDLFCLVDLFGGLTNAANPDRRVLRQFIGRVCALAWKRHSQEERRVCKRGDPRSAKHTPAVQMRHYFRAKAADSSPNHKLTWDGTGSVCLYEAFLSQVLYGERATLKAPALKKKPDYSENAIISLNYDLVIEREALHFDGVRIFYGEGVLAKNATTGSKIACDRSQLRGGRCLPLIKLHGSLNWKDPKDDQPITACEMNEMDGDATPLILPTWQRSAVGRKRSAALLHEARTHLRLASKLVFIGYSMPDTDRYLRYLFTEALAMAELPKVVICNSAWSESDAKKNCRRMLGSRITDSDIAAYRGLSEYVSSFTPEDSLE